MKAIKLLLASALLAGFATLAFAGPGPDSWARTQKIQKPQAKTQPAAETAKDPKACATCSCAAMKKS